MDTLELELEYYFDDIDYCECIGEFEDEYVYDIEMDDDTHTFIANDILVHNSLYISYENLLSTIEGYENMSYQDLCRILVDFNTGYLDAHNRQYMKEYFASRFADSIQDFELETVALSGVWLNVKKRYAQILLWKDGKYFDMDSLKMKTKGLELVKSSIPKQAREGLTRMVRYLLEDDGQEGMLIQRLNIKMQEEKQLWYSADLENICGSVGVNGYTKYIIDDTGLAIKVRPHCPFNVKALGNYNRLRNLHKLPGDPLYGGKIRWYMYLPKGITNPDKKEYFGFQASRYPDWASTYAPINKDLMFQQFMLDPFNRILSAIGMPELRIDGYIQLSLF